MRISTTSSVARFYTVPSLRLLKTSMLEYTLSLLLRSVPFENHLKVDCAKLLPPNLLSVTFFSMLTPSHTGLARPPKQMGFLKGESQAAKVPKLRRLLMRASPTNQEVGTLFPEHLSTFLSASPCLFEARTDGCKYTVCAASQLPSD